MMIDPVEAGMKMHQPLMLLIHELKPTEAQFMAIARLTDILVASAQVHAVRHGLEAGEPVMVAMIHEKLVSLGLFPKV